MSCIGVLYQTAEHHKPNPTNNIVVDMQSNYWKLPKMHWGYNRFLDVGLLVYDAKDITSLLFYLPFKTKGDFVSDLGESLAYDNLLSVLFNEPYQVSNNPNFPGYYYVSSVAGENKKPSFWLYSLSKANFKVRHLSQGTLIEIMIKNKPSVVEGIQNVEDKKDNYNLYFRFRISHLDDNSLGYIESVSNDFFQSVFSRTEMINLHINTIGEIEENDYKEIASKYSFVNFNKIHFFFVGSSKEEAISGMNNYTDIRLLDSVLWSRYVGDNNPQSRKCLAYHWKLSGPRENGNIFFRTVYSSANLIKVLKYSILIILFGMAASYAASYIPKWEKHIPVNELMNITTIQDTTLQVTQTE